MDFVGRRVKKEFKGHGTFFGTVQSYQPNTGFLRIVYEDGDSEELEFSEVALLLVPPGQLPLPSPQPLDSSPRKRGRRPKRRRITETGKSEDNSLVDGDVCDDLEGRGGDFSKLCLNLNEGLDFIDGGLGCLNNEDHGHNGVGDGAMLHGLDLNEGLDMEVDEGIDINEKVLRETSGVTRGLIDLNLDVNEGFENLSPEREGELFDLNLQLVEDDVINLDDHVGNTRAHEMVCTERDAQMRKELVENANMGVSENGDGGMGIVDLCKDQEEEDLLKATGADNENAVAESSQSKKRGRKRKATTNNKIEVSTPEIVELDCETGTLSLEVENREQTLLKNGCHSIDCDNGNSVGSSRGRRGRRRKELSDNNITLPASEMGLRRSSRRAKRDALSDQDHIFATPGLDRNKFQLSSPASSFVFEEKIMVSGSATHRGHILPPKVELPPSSCNLDLHGVSVFDFLSVYAFLRSFSTLLFLSPFELDDFAASVKSNDSSSLFDSIHVSLLKTLRKHLEVLTDEGSVSASKCLRSLNWDFLDLITWPIFAVEYLLLHSPGYIPGLDLCHLKLCQRDYYKLPVSVKVEIMRNLCDDVIEVDVFRSEINRRTLVTEQHMDFDRNTKLENSRKRKSMMDVATTSCLAEEDADEPADWNSDECHLCRMDGNLICCDGCPAAFHPRCVGVVSSLLPDGDWYCPDCAIDKDKPWMKVEKSIRGAELLGTDPYGRLYYGSCGYLLVLESCNDQYSFWLYDRNGLSPLIEALESPDFLYDTVINSICKQWNIVHEVDGTRNYLDNRTYSIKSTFPNKRQLLDMHLTTSETQQRYKVDDEKISDEKSIITTYSSNIDVENTEHDNVEPGTENHTAKVENRLESSEGSEVSQAFIIDVSKEGRLDCSHIGTNISLESYTPGNLVNAGDHFTISPTVVTRQRKNPKSENYGNAQPSPNNREIISKVYSWTKYVNCYEFARTASSVFEELISKPSDGTNALKSVEGIIAGQLKIISNSEFYWSNIHNSVVNSMKEKCGWCFYCKVPEEEKDCLFIMNDSFPAVENFKSEAFGIQSGNYKKNHLLDIMCHIICMEDHLHGLLLGPWLHPQYSELWRKCVLGVTNITSLKNLLLKVEANLNQLALYTGWRQNVDTVATMGSASHIVVSSSRISSKHGIRRKRAKGSEPQITPSSNAMSGLTLLWWRGGRGSRGLFNWKVLPRSLVSKAVRQGGCKKITGILYPEVGEYAKRTKCDAWRAAVETSRSVEQLALQVRELDANIRWDDIGQIKFLSKMDKESKKSARSFKKAIIRRKCTEGTAVRYLLDFGKRRFIPDIVARQGTMLEDSSSERKKYWLEESHIPLYLLKNFEEKRIARKSNKMSSGKLRDSSRVTRKPLEERGFSYLFSRAERLDNYQCQHCNKDVLIREAVSCRYCKGFFHKGHVRKSFGYITDDPSYTCHKCPDGEIVKTGDTEGKSGLSEPTNASKRLKLVQSGKSKRLVKGKPQIKSKKSKRAPVVVTLRRSARNAERMSKLSLQNTKMKKGKKKKRAKSQKSKVKKLDDDCWQKRRTPVNSRYWSNGLLLSRKPDDQRLTQFRNKMLLVIAGEVPSNNAKPKCSLCCELEYTPNLAYVACEICGVWFHGDALDLSADKIFKLIGFKCHRCLSRTPPICPHNFPSGINSTELMPKNNAETGCPEEDYKDPLSCYGPEDLKFTSDDEVKSASLNLVLEQQSPGLMPESHQK